MTARAYYKVPSRALDPVFVAKATGFPLSAWAGNCSGVCAEVLRSRIVKGELRRGLWVGCINKDSTLFRNRPFAGHTWIRLPNGRVYDPTRFAFAGDAPSIFVSYSTEEHCIEYDFGGNALRQAFRRPFPSDAQANDHWLDLKLSRSAVCKFHDLVGLQRPVFRTGFVLHLTWRQAAWLANCTLEELGEHAKEIYRGLVKLGHGSLIPYDNREAILGKSRP